MDNFKCLSAHICEVLNKKDTNVSIDLIDAYETLRRELTKSVEIAKKFKKELKLANLEKEKLIVRLDESSKKNEKLEQKLAEAKAKLENLSNSKFTVDDRSVSVSLKPKADNVYIPPFKRNHKENAYFVRQS